MPPGYLLLELSKLIVPQLGTSLSEERPAFDSLKSRLVFCTSEPVSIKLGSGTRRSHMSLRHFTEHLVGACLGMNSKRMEAMWHTPLLQDAL